MVCDRQVQACTTGGPYALTSNGEKVEDGVMARGIERKGRKACGKGEGKITVKQSHKHTQILKHTHTWDLISGGKKQKQRKHKNKTNTKKLKKT